MQTGGSPLNSGDESKWESARILMDPALLDRAIRQSIQHCWLTLPPGRRNAEELAAEMRRILDRALYDFARDLRRMD